VTDEELFELIVDAPAGERAALFDRHCAGDARTWQARRQPLPAASETNYAGRHVLQKELDEYWAAHPTAAAAPRIGPYAVME
jgi:hypothetical protein